MELPEKLFILHLDDRRYALTLAAVERVVRMVEITPLPQAPEMVLGLINLQGRVIPVLDLRRRFKIAPRPVRPVDVLVIARSGERTVALVADTVGEILLHPGQTPLPEPQIFPHLDYLSGVLKTDDGLILLCDLDRILSPEEERLLEELPCAGGDGEEVGAPPLEALEPPQGERQGGGREGKEAVRKLLRERARRLAQEPPQLTLPADQLEVVHFLLGPERYGIESVHVREVYPYRELVRLPGAPDFLLGIMNVRGKIHSVIDIRRFFELPVKGGSEFNKVIILQSPSMVFGILTDAILGVSPVELAALSPPPVTFTGTRAAYVRGVTGDGLTVLDGGKILSDRKLVVHMEV